MKKNIFLAYTKISLIGFVLTPFLFCSKNSGTSTTTTEDSSLLKTESTIILGKTYQTIIIGDQTWMKENIDSKDYSEGSSNYYDSNGVAILRNGRLYDVLAAKNLDQKISGWHLPTSAEWDKLAIYLGGAKVAGGKLLYYGNSNFKAILAGHQHEDGESESLGDGCFLVI